MPHAFNPVHANRGELACATGGSLRQQDKGRVLYDSCVFWASWNGGTATRTWSASETGVGGVSVVPPKLPVAQSIGCRRGNQETLASKPGKAGDLFAFLPA